MQDIVEPNTLQRIENLPTAPPGDAGGLAGPLDEDGRIPTVQIPPQYINNVYPVDDSSERLALDADVGDVATQADNGRTYQLKVLPASVDGNWIEYTVQPQTSSTHGGAGNAGKLLLLDADGKADGLNLVVLASEVSSASASVSAVVSAPVLTSTSSAAFSGEVNLGALTTGLLKHSVSGGTSTPATATQGVDYWAPGGTDVSQADGGTGTSTGAGAGSVTWAMKSSDFTTANGGNYLWTASAPSAGVMTLHSASDGDEFLLTRVGSAMLTAKPSSTEGVNATAFVRAGVPYGTTRWRYNGTGTTWQVTNVTPIPSASNVATLIPSYGLTLNSGRAESFVSVEGSAWDFTASGDARPATTTLNGHTVLYCDDAVNRDQVMVRAYNGAFAPSAGGTWYFLVRFDDNGQSTIWQMFTDASNRIQIKIDPSTAARRVTVILGGTTRSFVADVRIAFGRWCFWTVTLDTQDGNSSLWAEIDENMLPDLGSASYGTISGNLSLGAGSAFGLYGAYAYFGYYSTPHDQQTRRKVRQAIRSLYDLT